MLRTQLATTPHGPEADQQLEDTEKEDTVTLQSSFQITFIQEQSSTRTPKPLQATNCITANGDNQEIQTAHTLLSRCMLKQPNATKT